MKTFSKKHIFLAFFESAFDVGEMKKPQRRISSLRLDLYYLRALLTFNFFPLTGVVSIA